MKNDQVLTREELDILLKPEEKPDTVGYTALIGFLAALVLITGLTILLIH